MGLLILLLGVVVIYAGRGFRSGGHAAVPVTD
jgi:hypothetical protein